MLKDAAGIILCLALVCSGACAPKTVNTVQQASIDVHAVLAGIDDAEHHLYDSHALPAWTAEKHRQFSQYMVVALKAGLALNEAARVAPQSTDARSKLLIVVEQVGHLNRIVATVLPADHPVTAAINSASQYLLSILSIFLE